LSYTPTERRSCRNARPEARVGGSTGRLDFATSRRQLSARPTPPPCGSPQGIDAHLSQLRNAGRRCRGPA